MSIRNLYEIAKSISELQLPTLHGPLTQKIEDLKKAVESIDSDVFVKDVMYDVEKQFLDRAKLQFGVPAIQKRSAAYVKAEIEYLCGAMAAMQTLMPGKDNALSPLIRPKWPISLLGQRPPIDLKDHKL